MMRVLLVEDEKRMAEALAALLRLEKYQVTVCMDGSSGLEAVCTNEYDLLILDVMLPGVSGFEIARAAREQGKQASILMLTAKNDVDDKVTGLDSGADDYMTKPFEVRELLARLRALGRRHSGVAAETLAFGDITLEARTNLLHCTTNGNTVRLSKREYRIMEIFLLNHQQILTREQLAVNIWGYDSEAEYNNVEVYLTFTRKKLAFVESAVEIKALRGVGYELRDGRV